MLVSKKNNNNWTYDLTDHFMVDLETIIALASMTFIVDLGDYELRPVDEKVFDGFIDEC